MIRKIIKIDGEKCNGCGACAEACHEGAIEMADGKAKLAREDFCDGLGDCLPNCPAGAIAFEEREAPEYDGAAVAAAKREREHAPLHHAGHPGGCPGAALRRMERDGGADACPAEKSQLGQWPCQIKLVPVTAPYFDSADLLIAADCTAYAYAGFHAQFMRGRITLIGCPKLDAVDYSEKLSEIILHNDINSVTLLRMEVPCCGGLEMAAKHAIESSGKKIPCKVVTVSIDGEILN